MNGSARDCSRRSCCQNLVPAGQSPAVSEAVSACDCVGPTHSRPMS